MNSATAEASPNIALIKYWGNRDNHLRLPANGSISMNLAGLITRTKVTWLAEANRENSVMINGKAATESELRRVSEFLNLVRDMAGIEWDARVESENNFPTGAGIASSASAFAALALAATRAAGCILSEMELSRLARRGSGSACRSIPGGYVEWFMGSGEADSYAAQIAPPEHWDISDVIAIIDPTHKPKGSTEGHAIAWTSPLQARRVQEAPKRLTLCRDAILQRDFDALAAVTEMDSALMHAVMESSTPPLHYQQDTTRMLIQEIQAARAGGLAACTTVDAGPNVHVICEQSVEEKVINLVESHPGVITTRKARVGGGARLVDQN